MIASILLSVGFLSAVGILFAGLLLLAEKKILNYGPCKIDINEGDKEFEVQGGNTLLASLAENEIFIPSACGGRGSCAYCKVGILEGAGPVGPIEEPYLSDEDHKNNIRLSCQVKVRNDVKITVPKELFFVKKFCGKLEQKKVLTHDIVELRIALKEPHEISFVSGQYIQLQSEEYKGRDAVMRAYSISSKPSDTGHVEVIIRLVPDGICTTWVFDHLKEGQEVTFSGPYGDFILSETNAPIIFIAGGSGMAPVWSMLRDMKEKNINRKTYYFFGALTQQDLFFIDELKTLKNELPDFTFVPALSNEPDGSDYQGERGLITEIVDKTIPDTSQFEGYLCGSPGMIDACIKVLTKNGMPEDKIFYDKFA